MDDGEPGVSETGDRDLRAHCVPLTAECGFYAAVRLQRRLHERPTLDLLPPTGTATDPSHRDSPEEA